LEKAKVSMLSSGIIGRARLVMMFCDLIFFKKAGASYF